MLSRVAHSIYWLNRYIERAENVARFVEVNLTLSLDLAANMTQQWQPLVSIIGDIELFNKNYDRANANNVIRFLSFDLNYPNSIISCLKKARENARSSREIISSAMWEEVNSFYLMVKEASLEKIDSPSQFLNKIKMASHRFAGVMDATMTHNEAWYFGQMGRLLERAEKTTRLLDSILLPSELVDTTKNKIQWMSLLKSASAYQMYRQLEHRILPKTVIQFLVLNRQFPRSIHFCLWQVEQCLHEINNTPIGTWSNDVERSLGKLCSQLSYLAIEDIIDLGLHEFLNSLQISINKVGDEIHTTFFALKVIKVNN